METLKPTIPFCSRAALLATFCLISPLMAGEIGSSSSKNPAKTASLDEAQELLKKGDEAYTSQRYADAAEAYSAARELIPNSEAFDELKSAATERYAQAAVEQGRYLSRKGDVAGARAVVDKVLQPDVAPQNLYATKFRNELDDPIRTNPALNAAHARNVDTVRRLLYTAQGDYSLGKFKEAKANYEAVLRIDPTNTAARRGMEEVSQAKSRYADAAYDHTRAEMLAEVDKQWEQPVAPTDAEELAGGSLLDGQSAETATVAAKLENIIIPKVALEQASLQDAVDFLRVKAAEADVSEPDSNKKGVNIVINYGDPGSEAANRLSSARFDLRLSQVPLSQVLKQITEATQSAYRVDDYTVTISPTGVVSKDLIVRSFRVPPDFISSMSAGSGDSASQGAAPNPFDAAPTEKLLPKRLTAKEALLKQGVTFPEGAAAIYIPSNSTLRVVNTSNNLDLISQLIEGVARVEPVTVAVSVTMIKVEETHLQELGYDWILDNYGFGGKTATGSEFSLAGGTPGNGSDLSDITLAQGRSIRRPITGGNRSGDLAILGESIDGIIGDDSREFRADRAPGIFGLRGRINDSDLQVLLRGLEQKKSSDLMAQSTVTTRSSQSSTFYAVKEFIYPTEYEPPEIPQSVGSTGGGSLLFGLGSAPPRSQPITPATPTAFEKKDVGITLEVLPTVDANRQFVNLTILPTFNDFDGFINYGSPINANQVGPFGPTEIELSRNAILQPVFSTNRVNTNIDVADGATVVLGGLLKQSVQDVEDKTPILGSVPIVGRFFQTSARQPKSTAIVFLVKATIQDPTGRKFNQR